MIDKLQEIIDNSNKIVFFGGAGVSTESGIPDFRSPDGLYNQKYKYPPETMLSHSFYVQHTKEFYEFYRDKMLCLDAKPNIIHEKLAELEKIGKLIAIVTQNIDGLHTKAGNENVCELHGSIYRNFCDICGKFYDVDYILDNKIPKCENDNCNGIVKPDVVLYEEGLDNAVIEATISAISSCDTLIIGGTSLAVYPAASFINHFHGDNLVVINREELNVKADLVINDLLGNIFRKLK